MSGRRRVQLESGAGRDLERYGVLALIAALVLGVAWIAQLATGESPPLRAGFVTELPRIPDAPPSAGEPAAHAPRDLPAVAALARGASDGADAPGGGSLRTPAPRAHFDFFEAPVAVPGRPPVAAPPPPGEQGPSRRVAVRKGDTLQKIAARELGRSERWKVLLEWNPGIDPRRLQPGMQLELPPSARAAPAAPEAASAASARLHVVRSGDTLSSLAKRYYGDAQRWIDLLEANREQLSGPDDVRVGQKLRIP